MNEQQQRALAAGLKALAERTRHASASPHVELAVLAEMQKGGWSLTRFGALAAALLLIVGGALWTARLERPGTVVIQPDGFVSVPQAAALPDIESASIVRVSLPVAALPVYGVAIASGLTTESVQAELLVAQDGTARAIRLVTDTDISRSANND
jgi:hypothetical protein